MIPIRDQIVPHKKPIVNTLLIFLNIVVFVVQWVLTTDVEAFVNAFALIPANFVNSFSLDNLLDIFTSMFMHVGFLHLAGNMLYLWIFGDNVEDRLGHVLYLVFYLAGGTVGSLLHILTNPGSLIPTMGASGAIAAVLGAYLVLYPQSRILTFIPIGFLMRLRLIPASIVLGLWFVLQLFNGVLTLSGPDVGGTAFWAHVGGFLTGVLVARLFFYRSEPARNDTWS